MSQFVAVVDRFEGDFAVLKHKDHEILLPKEDLPENIKEGSFATIIISSGESEKKQEEKTEDQVREKINEVVQGGEGKEKKQESKAEDEAQKKVNETLSEVREDQGIVTSEDRMGATFQSKPFGQKVSEVINDILQASLGQETSSTSPEEKQIEELRGVGKKMDRVNKNIEEEIREHKTHE
jgi:hypothetical protein